MKVTYLGHSGFLLETDAAYFVFDYYTGRIPELNKEKPLLIFSSHRHPDHYNREIWKLRKQYPKVQYILSKDINFSQKAVTKLGLTEEEASKVIRLAGNADRTLALENGHSVRIETFRSTDEGVAFYLTIDKKTTVFHAGDLHLWLWEEEGSGYMKQMEKNFYQFTQKLKGRHTDIAFLLLDPRLENHTFDGMDAYIEMLHPSVVFPMHMWDKYYWIDRYLKARPEIKRSGIMKKMEAPGQSFHI